MPGAAVRHGRSPWLVLVSLLLCAHALRPCAALLQCTTPGRDGAACFALGQLYSSAVGDAWTERGGWADAAAGVATDYCSFEGVTCDGAGVVTGLSLVGNNLQGSLPDALGQLTALTTLDVSNNVLQGTVPASLGNLTRLTSLSLAVNLLQSYSFPASFAQLTRLQSLNVTSNIFSGPLPAFLGLLPLTSLAVARNSFTGIVPATLGALQSLTTLSLGKNLLDSAYFPASLCPFACGATDGEPFICPVQHNCSQPGCVPQCMYPACPLQRLTAANFSFVSASCAQPAPAQSCLVCLPAIASVFHRQGVTDVLLLESCVVTYAPQYMEAGANALALSAISDCSAMYGWDKPSSSSCQLDLPGTSFTSSAAACADPKFTCSVCTSELLNVFVRAGLPVTDYSANFGLAQYYMLEACIDTHLRRILAAGASAATLALIPSCPRPVGFPVAATLAVGGVSRAGVNNSSFADAVAAAVSVRSSEVTVQNVTDAQLPAVASLGRRLLAAGVLVRLTVSLASVEEQARVALALQTSATAAVVLAQLQAAGLAATSVVLVSLDDGTHAGTAGAETVSPGTVVGAVVGSVLGACAVAAAVGALVRWRRRGAAAAASGCVPSPKRQSESAQATLASLALLQASSDSGSSPDDTSMSGWRAVTCDASEVALSERIGAGAFATVYSAAWRGSQVAVKVWQPLDMHQQVAIRVDGSRVSLNTAPGGTVGAAAEVDVSFMREVALLSSLRHPNILAIYALVKAPPMLVMELAPAGSLKDLLARTQLENLGWRRRLGIAIGVACGVEHLHAQSPPICHFDLKCGNVVLDTALVPKVADFGVSWVARHGTPGQTVTRGTPRYMAPEVARGSMVTNFKGVDAYGFGMVLHDVCHVNTDAGAPARLARAGVDAATALTQTVSGENTMRWSGIQVLFQREVENYLPAMAPHVPAPLCALMRVTLQLEPDARPSLTELRTRLMAMTEAAAAW